jgi:hypothetical protein
MMKALRVPGIENFIKKYGDNWDFNLKTHQSMRELLNSEIPVLGIPENGDICHLIKCDSEGGGDIICLLVRISDGKYFLVGKSGFKPYKDTIKEQEDDLEWARDLVSGVVNYWDLAKQTHTKNLGELKFKLIPKPNGDSYFKESLDQCGFNGNVEWWYRQIFKIDTIKRMVRNASDCEAGYSYGMDLEEDVWSAQLVKCLTDDTDYDLPYWINEDMVDIIIVG